MEPLSDVDAFNYVLGTQSIGATYQFTEETLLVETARAVLGLGSNIFKFTMGRGYERMMLKPSKAAYPETMQYLLNQGSDAREALRIEFPGASIQAPSGNSDIQNLTDLAQLEPAYRQVLGMPFAYYLIWTYAFSPGWWHQGMTPENREKEYQEICDFTKYLLTTYSGTGKTFFLGHWEGDWHLRPNLKVDTDTTVTSAALQGMADWLNIRQQAVDDAKRETPHHAVEVYHYTEVNHVSLVSMAGRPSVTNSVLPKTNVDYVSYSTYDSLQDIPGRISKALDYIDSKLPLKPEISGKRVFIGEYGFAARVTPEVERDRKSRQVMRIGLEWGCPFVLCWQMYNNEFKDGQENGYWLINDRGAKQPLWHTHHDFYQKARRYVADFKQKEGRLPPAEEFRRSALEILDDLPLIENSP
ncbi:MAG: hypothetical protein ACYC6N_14620 [Pirellulaceae bacterium]